MSVELFFPPKETLSFYLKQYLHTSNETGPYFEASEKIIDVMADFFANKSGDPINIRVKVMLNLSDLNEKLKLPMGELVEISNNLIAALTNCAARKA